MPPLGAFHFLLTAANRLEENEKLARTGNKEMKNTLMKIFGEMGVTEGGCGTGILPIKEECMYGSYSRGRVIGKRRNVTLMHVLTQKGATLTHVIKMDNHIDVMNVIQLNTLPTGAHIVGKRHLKQQTMMVRK